MSDHRASDSDQSKRDIPSFIEPRPPLISNPFMRPRPQKGTNLLELFEEDSDCEEAEWVQVYLRLKPCNVKSNLYEVKSDRCLITSVDTATVGHGRRTQHNISKMYTFSHIFGPESNQKEIFENVVKENLKKLVDGNNFTLLTYGASGSGKTYTLMGTVASPGLVPRSLEYVFRVVEAAQTPLYKPADASAEMLSVPEQDYELQWVKRLRHVSAPLREKYRRMSAQLRCDVTTSTLDLSNRTTYYVWVSFVEIYNEAIYDLLSNCDRSKSTSKLRIREDASGNVYVKGATQAFVRTGEEAYDVMVAGKHNLQVAATGVHAHSSRSHCIFTITMLTKTETGVRTSCVRLCDLAGCERARHTRNTGARMQESRAINSSLHVLERCLHTLRRKQRARAADLVPYRESKLTRLLGAGLSGARGEAVSMVVTLNPAPQYAHESRHVLQLAAVARDIQVNSTMALESTLSTLESSTQDTTVECNAEIIKLRSENERLHFELLQAEARNKDLISAMEEKQQEVARTMFEIVEEAKDMTKQYYEAQIQSLRSEMEDMQEEYESRLKAAAQTPGIQRRSDVGTPSRAMQKKITQLMTEIAILEEKLTAERLARARAEEEVQHLRACIDERDEKADEDEKTREDVVSLSESESEEENDPFNESLEPTFKKEDINKSILLQRSVVHDADESHFDIDDDRDNTVQDVVDNDSVLEKSGDTLKKDNDSHDDTRKDSTYMTGENDSSDKFGETNNSVNNDTNINDVTNDRHKVDDVRGTYFVRVEDMDKSEHVEHSLEKSIENDYKDNDNLSNMQMRGTYFVKDGEIQNKSELKTFNDDVPERSDVNHSTEVKKPRSFGDYIVSKLFTQSKHERDGSLAQFEQLEIDAQNTNMEILKEKRMNYFEENETDSYVLKVSKMKKPFFDNIDGNIGTKKTELLTKVTSQSDDRSPSIVKDDVTNDFEPCTIKRLLGESFTRQPDVISCVKCKTAPRKPVSVDIFEGFDSPQNFIKARESTEILKSACKFIEDSIASEKTKDNALEKNAAESIASVTGSDRDTARVITHVFNLEKQELVLDSTEVNDIENIIKTSADSMLLEVNKGATLDGVSPVKTGTGKTENENNIESTRISIENLVLQHKSNTKQPIDNAYKINLERVSTVEEPKQNAETLSNPNETVSNADACNASQRNSKENNTIDDFENIYKDITEPRATEFDLILSQEVSTSNVNEEIDKEEKSKYNLRQKLDKSIEDKQEINTVLLESQSKCESKPVKRNLRLRRRKNQTEDDIDNVKEVAKLKDIVNLQKEFSDVTLDVPATAKEVHDIPSPEKVAGQENLPPTQGIQSCPSKSVTRSRRKLFTPRPEPLEESVGPADSDERVCVPRPSYHRARARRKL